MRTRGNFFVKILGIALVIIAIITIIRLQMQLNELDEQKKELAIQIEAYRDKIDELKYELELPIDEEYMIRLARKKLGYHFPNEKIYYYDLIN